MTGFEYPTSPHIRRHGPAGYRDYVSYRDWLRDEFTFRCVYCLHREQWYSRSGAFHIDHFVPVSADIAGDVEYSNLVYACAACNEAKVNIPGLPDPTQVGLHECLEIRLDGNVIAKNPAGEKLREVLRLNSDANVLFRSRMIRLLVALRQTRMDLYREFMGWPQELPDLRVKRVPRNDKPEGAANCYFAQRERGELPLIY